MQCEASQVRCGRRATLLAVPRLANSLRSARIETWEVSSAWSALIDMHVADERRRYTRKRNNIGSVQSTASSSVIQAPSSESVSSDLMRGPLPENIHGTPSGQPHELNEHVAHHTNTFADAPGATTCPQSIGHARDNDNHQDRPQCSYIVEVIYRHNDNSTERSDVQYSIPAFLADESASNSRQSTCDVLTLQDANSLPPKHICDRLIRVFFKIVHPAYPVLNRARFHQSYLQGAASNLVLHTILFVAYTVSDEASLRLAGCTDRLTAKTLHYKKAKLLYDADLEPDKYNIVACLLLFGFWWAGVEEQKDTCYWVGCAVVLAQNLRLHRYRIRGSFSDVMLIII